MENAAPTLNDLLLALDFASSDFAPDSQALLCRRTGVIHYRGDDVDESLPDDIDDGERYIALPHKKELGLGKPLALSFAEDRAPALVDQVYAAFSRRGAYAAFKALLLHHGKLDEWYAYEDEATRAALREWCADNGIRIGP